ncbi:MAG: hypothetical protein RL387_1704 [Bacteroidota bacterium]|jgi:FKBP-type peptidyl-prolyl cis-trans isomerase FkpA
MITEVAKVKHFISIFFCKFIRLKCEGMKNIIMVITASMISVIGLGQKLDQSTLPLNSTSKQIGLITSLNISSIETGQKGTIGISTSQSKLYLTFKKNKSKIIFEVPNANELLSTGLNTKTASNTKVEWNFDATQEKQYKLYIANTSDSAKNYIIYSGYLYFPTLNKWKLIASFKVNGTSETIVSANSFKSSSTEIKLDELFTDTWAQTDNGAWLKIQNTGMQKPALPPFSDIDSLARAEMDMSIIQKVIQENQTDAKNFKNGLYYTLMKTSTKSDLVKITDTVTIFYKGYIMGTDIIFDQTANEPRVFPLGRLIKGWQLGLDGTHVGEKVKLLIPSGLAYSIRTRSPMIPPNSILVFEIETVDTKHSTSQ